VVHSIPKTSCEAISGNSGSLWISPKPTAVTDKNGSDSWNQDRTSNIIQLLAWFMAKYNQNGQHHNLTIFSKKSANFNPLKITFCHLQPLLGLLNARHAHLHVMPKRCVPLDPASLRSCGKPQQKPTPIYLFLEGSWWRIVANFNA
jgi:hypothetical protein